MGQEQPRRGPGSLRKAFPRRRPRRAHALWEHGEATVLGNLSASASCSPTQQPSSPAGPAQGHCTTFCCFRRFPSLPSSGRYLVAPTFCCLQHMSESCVQKGLRAERACGAGLWGASTRSAVAEPPASLSQRGPRMAEPLQPCPSWRGWTRPGGSCPSCTHLFCTGFLSVLHARQALSRAAGRPRGPGARSHPGDALADGADRRPRSRPRVSS